MKRLSESIRVLIEQLSSDPHGNLEISYKGRFPGNIVLEADAATMDDVRKLGLLDHLIADLRYLNGRVTIELPTISYNLQTLYRLMLSNSIKEPRRININCTQTTRTICDADGEFLAHLTIESEDVRCSIIKIPGLMEKV